MAVWRRKSGRADLEFHGPRQVNGCPKTIDGDLKNEYVPVSFGFDTAAKTFRYLDTRMVLSRPSPSAVADFLFCFGQVLQLIPLLETTKLHAHRHACREYF